MRVVERFEANIENKYSQCAKKVETFFVSARIYLSKGVAETSRSEVGLKSRNTLFFSEAKRAK